MPAKKQTVSPYVQKSSGSKKSSGRASHLYKKLNVASRTPMSTHDMHSMSFCQSGKLKDVLLDEKAAKRVVRKDFSGSFPMVIHEIFQNSANAGANLIKIIIEGFRTTVIDNGKGMDEEEVTDNFSKYYKEDNLDPDTRDKGGKGVKMAFGLCKEIRLKTGTMRSNRFVLGVWSQDENDEDILMVDSMPKKKGERGSTVIMNEMYSRTTWEDIEEAFSVLADNKSWLDDPEHEHVLEVEVKIGEVINDEYVPHEKDGIYRIESPQFEKKGVMINTGDRTNSDSFTLNARQGKVKNSILMGSIELPNGLGDLNYHIQCLDASKFSKVSDHAWALFECNGCSITTFQQDFWHLFGLHEIRTFQTFSKVCQVYFTINSMASKEILNTNKMGLTRNGINQTLSDIHGEPVTNKYVYDAIHKATKQIVRTVHKLWLKQDEDIKQVDTTKVVEILKEKVQSKGISPIKKGKSDLLVKTGIPARIRRNIIKVKNSIGFNFSEDEYDDRKLPAVYNEETNTVDFWLFHPSYLDINGTQRDTNAGMLIKQYFDNEVNIALAAHFSQKHGLDFTLVRNALIWIDDSNIKNIAQTRVRQQIKKGVDKVKYLSGKKK